MWKPIKGYEGLYEVDELGNVKALEKQKRHVSRFLHEETLSTIKEKILKPGKDALGYHHYILTKNGKTKLIKAQHIVAEAFLGYDRSKYKTDGLYVAHKNGIKNDNRVENLEIRTKRK